MKKMVFTIGMIFIISFSLFSASLWNDRAKDIYAKKIYYNVGDTILILIAEENGYSYKAETKSLKNYKIELGQNKLSALFDFTPNSEASVNNNQTESDALSIKNTVQARITNVAGTVLTITGRKQVSINNKVTDIEISGTCHIDDIVNHSVFSYKVINPVMRMTTVLENRNQALTERDLINKITELPDGQKKEETVLDEEKERELILSYFNKILNLIL